LFPAPLFPARLLSELFFPARLAPTLILSAWIYQCSLPTFSL
jgi:hypothetical protein